MSAPVPAPEAERRRGYARWNGERSARARWWVIARGNLALALSNGWVRGALIASLIPGVILSGITYFFLPLSARALIVVLTTGMLFAFLIAALVGARLVSEDRRQGAFLAHFARPVTRGDYIAGKAVALFLPLFAVSIGSPLFGIVADMSVDAETVAERIGRELGEPIPDESGLLREASYPVVIGAVLAFGAIVAAGTTGLVLGISALTTRARTAGVVWFALVAFGGAAHGILADVLDVEWPALLSWMDNVRDLGAHLLGLSSDADVEFTIVTRAFALLAPSAIGLFFVHWQLRRAEGGAR